VTRAAATQVPREALSSGGTLYCSGILSVDQPKIAISWRGVAPASAAPVCAAPAQPAARRVSVPTVASMFAVAAIETYHGTPVAEVHLITAAPVTIGTLITPAGLNLSFENTITEVPISAGSQGGVLFCLSLFVQKKCCEGTSLLAVPKYRAHLSS